MRKTKYDIEFFLSNPSFVKWVNNPNKESDYFWKKWVESHPQDKKSFYAARTIVKRMGFKTAKVTAEDKESILEKILKEEDSEHHIGVRQKRYIPVKLNKQIMQIAAAAVVLFGIGYYLVNHVSMNSVEEVIPQTYRITKQTERGQHKKIVLPDGTKVVMNASTTLEYSSDFGKDRREVVLNGEAYFDVTHNPDIEFVVKSGNISTVVHGTAFNVSAYPDGKAVNVALERGLVAIHEKDEPNGDSIFIHPGEKLTVSESLATAVKSKFNYMEEFGWKERVLVFKDSNIDEFIAKLERWYNVDISVVGSTDEDWKINGMFKKQSLENVLEGLEFARKVDYSIKEDKITIYTSMNN